MILLIVTVCACSSLVALVLGCLHVVYEGTVPHGCISKGMEYFHAASCQGTRAILAALTAG